VEVSVWAPLLVMGPGTVYRLYPPLGGPDERIKIHHFCSCKQSAVHTRWRR